MNAGSSISKPGVMRCVMPRCTQVFTRGMPALRRFSLHVYETLASTCSSYKIFTGWFGHIRTSYNLSNQVLQLSHTFICWLAAMIAAIIAPPCITQTPHLEDLGAHELICKAQMGLWVAHVKSLDARLDGLSLTKQLSVLTTTSQTAVCIVEHKPSSNLQDLCCVSADSFRG